jgi:hypothetical protein
MTKAICMNCGERKFGAFVDCPKCKFRPQTLLDLTMSEMYSDHHATEEGLKNLAATVVNNIAVTKYRVGTFKLDSNIFSLLELRLANQTFRDILTLVRKAKDGIFRKELNVHLIGPDGYQSFVSVRGKEMDKNAFDKTRGEGGGDLYMSYCYESGTRKTRAISKRDWYILYDKMLLAERQARFQSTYLNVLDKIFEPMLDNYLEHGTIAPLSKDKYQLDSQSADEFIVSSFSEGQSQFADEIEALSDREAKDAYGALVSIVHQFTRVKAGLGAPIAVDDTEVFLKSFEVYIDRLDKQTAKDLEIDYEAVRRSCTAPSTEPKVRHGAQALMVVILGEMIRREGASNGKHDMAGYERARCMLDRLERSLTEP